MKLMRKTNKRMQETVNFLTHESSSRLILQVFFILEEIRRVTTYCYTKYMSTNLRSPRECVSCLEYLHPAVNRNERTSRTKQMRKVFLAVHYSFYFQPRLTIAV